MYPLVIDLNQKDVAEDLIHEWQTERLHDSINREQKNRELKTAQAAQDRARAAKKVERSRNIRMKQKWAHTGRIALATALVAATYYANDAGHASEAVFFCVTSGACGYIGWNLNSLTRLFRRKGRRA